MVVRSGPMPASDNAATTLTLAGNAAAASRADPLNTHSADFNPSSEIPLLDQVGRAGETRRRLAGDHLHRVDGAFGGGRNRVEADQGAGRHDDLAASGAREIDELGTGQQRTGAEHHHLLAGAQHRPAYLIEDRRRRTFDNEVGMVGQIAERYQRTGDAFAVKPGLAPWLDPLQRTPARARPGIP